EAEERDPPIVGTHPPVPLLKKRDYHSGLPIQRHRPRCPRDVAESSQPRQPYNIQSLKELWADLIHPWGLATEEFFDYLSNFSPGDTCMVVLRRSSKYSFHRSTISQVEVSSTPSPLYTVLTVPCFPFLRCQMVVQNLFEAVEEVVLHGLIQLFPCPGLCLGNRRSCSPLGLPVPICCLRNPTGQKGPIRLLLQPDGPHNMFGSARSVRHPSPPTEPTHHQVVISWQLVRSTGAGQLTIAVTDNLIEIS
ncbi:hypothetical protein D4764_0104300, partial [Takifugu flavidus]